MLINLRNALMTGGKPTARDYFSDYGIALWSGIENLGFGEHSNSTRTWFDLWGHYNLTCNSISSRWEENGFRFDGTYAFASSSATIQRDAAQGWTAECVYSLSASMQDYTGLFGNRCTGKSPGIYGLNYWSGQGGYGCGTSTGTAADAFTQNETPQITSITSLNTIHSMSLSLSADNVVTLYGDGVLLGRKSWNYFPNQSEVGYMLGRGYALSLSQIFSRDASRVFKGKIFCHRLYSRALPESVVLQNLKIDRAIYT